MILTVEQATTYAERAGFTGKSLQIIVAIAQAESGLNTTNFNPNDPNGGSFGVLQINGAHFGAAWTGGVMSQAQANDPQTAFDYAYYLSAQGTNFEAWGTFDPKNGTTPAYLQYMNGSAPTTSTPTSTPTATTGFGGIDWGWLSQPARIVKMTVGLVLIGISLFLLLSSNPEVQKLTKDAVKVAAL
jgi:Lysozyme like domain